MDVKVLVSTPVSSNTFGIRYVYALLLVVCVILLHGCFTNAISCLCSRSCVPNDVTTNKSSVCMTPVCGDLSFNDVY